MPSPSKTHPRKVAFACYSSSNKSAAKKSRSTDTLWPTTYGSIISNHGRGSVQMPRSKCREESDYAVQSEVFSRAPNSFLQRRNQPFLPYLRDRYFNFGPFAAASRSCSRLEDSHLQTVEHARHTSNMYGTQRRRRRRL